MTHTHTHTHTHSHMQTVTGKNWGLWKRAKPELSEAPMAQCILKHHGVTDAVPSWERLAEAQTLLGALFQMTTKRKKVSVESVGPAVFFTPDECGSLGANTLCFSVGPGYGAVPEHWSTILLSVQKSLLCTAKEKKRLRGIFIYFFSSFNHDDIPLFFFCKHSATYRTTWPDCTGEILLL